MSMGEKLMEFLARSKAAGHAGLGMGKAGIGAAKEVPGMIRRNPIASALGAGAGGSVIGAAGGHMIGGDDEPEELDMPQDDKDIMLRKFLAMHGGGM